MPKETLHVAVAAARTAPTGASEARALSLVEVVQLGLIWRWSRQTVGVSGEVAPQGREPECSIVNTRYAKNAKLSTVLYQTKETDGPELTPEAYDLLLKKHQKLVGRERMTRRRRDHWWKLNESTEDQLVALQMRVIDRSGTPYADFAVLTPYGRRLPAALRARVTRRSSSPALWTSPLGHCQPLKCSCQSAYFCHCAVSKVLRPGKGCSMCSSHWWWQGHAFGGNVWSPRW